MDARKVVLQEMNRQARAGRQLVASRWHLQSRRCHSVGVENILPNLPSHFPPLPARKLRKLFLQSIRYRRWTPTRLRRQGPATMPSAILRMVFISIS